MELQQRYISGGTVETVYFGGGTPSLLGTGELERILDRLRSLFRLEQDVEITLEANPDDITTSGKLKGWKKAGINRLSIGVQSFFEEDLQWMNRAHNAGQALTGIKLAQEEGFTNISADLIYGGPTLPDSHWKRNVEQVIQLGIPHLSCYALTVEPNTALDKMIHRKKVAAVDPEDQARQFLLLMEWLGQAGYEHYEISNFALPGRRSRHNSSYWQGRQYLGLGPSAHSYDGVSRQWNIANNARYIESLQEGKLVFEKEDLTTAQQLNEYVMISLRTMEGCDLHHVSERFGEGAAGELRVRAERWVREGKMEIRRTGIEEFSKEGGRMGIGNEWMVLTRDGKLLADGITAELFFDPAYRQD